MSLCHSVCLMYKESLVQGGEDPSDASSCTSFFAKEPLIIELFCRKRPTKIRRPVGLRHLVSQTCDMCTPAQQAYYWVGFKIHIFTYAYWVGILQILSSHVLYSSPSKFTSAKNPCNLKETKFTFDHLQQTPTCIYEKMYKYVYMHICICLCIYTYVYMYTHICMYTYVYIYMNV